MATPRRITAPPGGFRQIAVLRLSSLGDVILTLPVVHALARAFPAARIAYWVKEEYREVVAHDPAIHHVRVLEREARRLEDLLSMAAELEEADLIVDLHGQLRTRLLTWRQKAPVLRAASFRVRRSAQIHARILGLPAPPSALERNARALAPLGLPVPVAPRVEVGGQAETWAREWLEAGGGGHPIALLPGARHATKRWPDAHWAELVRRLDDKGQRICVIARAAERAELPDLHAAVAACAAGTWIDEPLARVGAILGLAAAAVSNDSGLMHLAAARGARVVALFGSTAPELGFAPAGPGHAVLCRREPCQPCSLHGRASCPRGHFHCMNRLAVDDVAAALAGILSR